MCTHANENCENLLISSWEVGGEGDFTIHGKTLVRTFVDVGDLFLGALDSECSWRLQSEGEPDTQEDFGVKNKHKLQHQFLSLATLRTPSQSLIVTQLPSFLSFFI